LRGNFAHLLLGASLSIADAAGSAAAYLGGILLGRVSVAGTGSYPVWGVGTRGDAGCCLVALLVWVRGGFGCGVKRRQAVGRRNVWAALMYWANGAQVMVRRE